MFKITLFAAATIYMLPSSPQIGCGITDLRMNPESQVYRSLQRKPGRTRADSFEVKVSNGAYWTQSTACKRQKA